MSCTGRPTSFDPYAHRGEILPASNARRRRARIGGEHVSGVPDHSCSPRLRMFEIAKRIASNRGWNDKKPVPTSLSLLHSAKGFACIVIDSRIIFSSFGLYFLST